MLPFASVGVETDPYVTDGLSDELRNQFSHMQSLTVTASWTVAAAKFSGRSARTGPTATFWPCRTRPRARW